jgi:multiple sugar transport system substrate-binding protein
MSERGHERAEAGGAVSRRELIRGTAGLAGAALVGAAGGAGRTRAQQPVEIVFSFAPDDSGSMDNLIAAFNETHEGRFRVVWREMPRESDAYRQQLESDFLVESPEIDVIGGDVIWTAPFAYNNWIRDLSGRFHTEYDVDDFLDASMDSTVFRNRLWAVPWFSDAGMLYYRRDLLEGIGIERPPHSWDDLKVAALRVKEESGVPHGLVFQGGQYEGGVTNALEYIWSAGGRVLTGNIMVAGAFGMAVIDPNVVTVNSPATARGLDVARSLIEDGVAPEEVATFNEHDSLAAFMAGEAVFMRNWPFAYGVIQAASNAAITVDQVGIAPIPVTPPGQRSFSCLGGWNLMISAFSQKADAAWAFIRFATTAEAQKRRAIEGGFLPTLHALYRDPEIREQMPVVALAEEVFPTIRARPISPFYPDVSARLAIAFNRVLRGELTGLQAARRLDGELRTIIRRSR